MRVDYEKLYQNNPKAFSQTEPFLVKYLTYVKPNWNVFDIGCFQGSNLRPFIEIGVNKVCGVDIFRNPLVDFSNNIYQEYGIEGQKCLDLKLVKVEDYKFEINFDMVMCFRVLHQLSKEDSIILIDKIQRHTNNGGYNLFIFWENGERYNTDLGYFTKSEFIELYQKSFLSKWDILECIEKKVDSSNAIYFAAKKK